MCNKGFVLHMCYKGSLFCTSVIYKGGLFFISFCVIMGVRWVLCHVMTLSTSKCGL